MSLLTYASVILFCELLALGRHKTDLRLNFISSWHSAADCDLCALCIRLRIQVLANKAGNMTIIPRNMLIAHFVGGTADPVGSVSAAVAKHILERFVLRCHAL